MASFYAMRTTLNLDDDVLDLLKDYAETRSVPLGKAASELVRRGLEAPVRTRLVNGFHTVVLPANSAQVTSEKVKQLLEDEI
jgi:hypothetical protein